MATSLVSAVYESDIAIQFNIRMSSDDLAAAGASTKSLTANFHQAVSNSSRRYGIHPRYVLLKRAKSATDSSVIYKRLYIPTPTQFANLVIAKTIDIGPTTWTVVRGKAEFYV